MEPNHISKFLFKFLFKFKLWKCSVKLWISVTNNVKIYFFVFYNCYSRTFVCILNDKHTVILFSGIRHGNKCVSLTWYIETESGANLMLDDVGLAISETVCWFSSISSSNSSNHQLNAAGRKTTEVHSYAVFWPLLSKLKHWTAPALSGKTVKLNSL